MQTILSKIFRVAGSGSQETPYSVTTRLMGLKSMCRFLPDDAAVMLDETALGAMSKVVAGRGKRDGDNNNEEPAERNEETQLQPTQALGWVAARPLQIATVVINHRMRMCATKLKQDLAEKIPLSQHLPCWLTVRRL
jgi:hypothetical protein